VVNAERACETEPDENTAVLVVEDEVLIRLMIADALRAQGLKVIEASDGDEAMCVLQSSLPVHLVLTDVRLPSKTDGLGLARFARAARPDVRLIVASSHHVDGDIGGVADAFFAKPYNVRAMVETVRKLLSES
jgi:two-component system, response regulator PdtaR